MPPLLTTRAPAQRRKGAVPAEETPRRRGRPPRLSRPAILAKALQLVDDEGAAALTMRRLGAELGVEAMSLYRHVENKRALLDGIAEQLMAELDDCGEYAGSDWAQAAKCMSKGLRAVARAHPAAFELVGTRALNTNDALRPVETLLGHLRAGGFDADHAVAAYRLLTSYVRGFALAEIAGFSLTSGGEGPTARLTARQLPAAEFPNIHRLARPLAQIPADNQFHAGLDTILTGLRLELEAASAPAPAA